MRQNFIAQFVQLLKHWPCGVRLGVVKNWADSVDQWQLQALQFWVHLIDLLSILLRCNGFVRIQKAVVDQTGSRSPNSEQNLFLVQVWLWEVFGASSWSNHWAGHRQLSYKIHFSLHVTIWLRNGSLLLCSISEHNTSKRFLDLWSAHKAPTYWAFSPFQFASNAKWPQNGRHWVLWQPLM